MKHRSFSITTTLGILLLLISCSAERAEKVRYITFTTSMGDIKIMLYNETPGHRDNIIKLAKEGFYDGVKFHRILNDFMIQAGNPLSKEEITEETAEAYNYTIPAEIKESLYHKKGVLAAARTGDEFNPARASSGTQFYIVEGRVLNDEELDNIIHRVNTTLQKGIFYKNLINEKKRVVDEGDTMTDAEIQEFATIVSYDEIAEMTPFTISEERREIYKTIGGTPHLDMQYTVYGEVVEGLDIVDLISNVETDQRGKPANDVVIIKAKVSNK